MGPVYFEIFKLEKEKKLEKIKVEVPGEKSEKSMKIHGFEHQMMIIHWNRVHSLKNKENQTKPGPENCTIVQHFQSSLRPLRH